MHCHSGCAGSRPETWRHGQVRRSQGVSIGIPWFPRTCPCWWGEARIGKQLLEGHQNASWCPSSNCLLNMDSCNARLTSTMWLSIRSRMLLWAAWSNVVRIIRLMREKVFWAWESVIRFVKCSNFFSESCAFGSFLILLELPVLVCHCTYRAVLVYSERWRELGVLEPYRARVCCYFPEMPYRAVSSSDWLLYWTVTWLICYLNQLLRCRGMIWLSCYFTELFLDWAVTISILLLEWSVTSLSCYFTELYEAWVYWARATLMGE